MVQRNTNIGQFANDIKNDAKNNPNAQNIQTKPAPRALDAWLRPENAADIKEFKEFRCGKKIRMQLIFGEHFSDMSFPRTHFFLQ